MFSVFRMSALTYFIFQQVELLGQLAKYLQKLVALLLLPKELQVNKFLDPFSFACTLGLLPCLSKKLNGKTLQVLKNL